MTIDEPLARLWQKDRDFVPEMLDNFRMGAEGPVRLRETVGRPTDLDAARRSGLRFVVTKDTDIGPVDGYRRRGRKSGSEFSA